MPPGREWVRGTSLLLIPMIIALAPQSLMGVYGSSPTPTTSSTSTVSSTPTPSPTQTATTTTTSTETSTRTSPTIYLEVSEVGPGTSTVLLVKSRDGTAIDQFTGRVVVGTENRPPLASPADLTSLTGVNSVPLTFDLSGLGGQRGELQLHLPGAGQPTDHSLLFTIRNIQPTTSSVSNGKSIDLLYPDPTQVADGDQYKMLAITDLCSDSTANSLVDSTATGAPVTLPLDATKAGEGEYRLCLQPPTLGREVTLTIFNERLEFFGPGPESSTILAGRRDIFGPLNSTGVQEATLIPSTGNCATDATGNPLNVRSTGPGVLLAQPQPLLCPSGATDCGSLPASSLSSVAAGNYLACYRSGPTYNDAQVQKLEVLDLTAPDSITVPSQPLSQAFPVTGSSKATGVRVAVIPNPTTYEQGCELEATKSPYQHTFGLTLDDPSFDFSSAADGTHQVCFTSSNGAYNNQLTKPLVITKEAAPSPPTPATGGVIVLPSPSSPSTPSPPSAPSVPSPSIPRGDVLGVSNRHSSGGLLAQTGVACIVLSGATDTSQAAIVGATATDASAATDSSLSSTIALPCGEAGERLACFDTSSSTPGPYKFAFRNSPTESFSSVIVDIISYGGLKEALDLRAESNQAVPLTGTLVDKGSDRIAIVPFSVTCGDLQSNANAAVATVPARGNGDKRPIVDLSGVRTTGCAYRVCLDNDGLGFVDGREFFTDIYPSNTAVLVPANSGETANTPRRVDLSAPSSLRFAGGLHTSSDRVRIVPGTSNNCNSPVAASSVDPPEVGCTIVDGDCVVTTQFLQANTYRACYQQSGGSFNPVARSIVAQSSFASATVAGAPNGQCSSAKAPGPIVYDSSLTNPPQGISFIVQAFNAPSECTGTPVTSTSSVSDAGRFELTYPASGGAYQLCYSDSTSPNQRSKGPVVVVVGDACSSLFGVCTPAPASLPTPPSAIPSTPIAPSPLPLPAPAPAQVPITSASCEDDSSGDSWGILCPILLGLMLCSLCSAILTSLFYIMKLKKKLKSKPQDPEPVPIPSPVVKEKMIDNPQHLAEISRLRHEIEELKRRAPVKEVEYIDRVVERQVPIMMGAPEVDVDDRLLNEKKVIIRELKDRVAELEQQPPTRAIADPILVARLQDAEAYIRDMESPRPIPVPISEPRPTRALVDEDWVSVPVVAPTTASAMPVVAQVAAAAPTVPMGPAPMTYFQPAPPIPHGIGLEEAPMPRAYPPPAPSTRPRMPITPTNLHPTRQTTQLSDPKFGRGYGMQHSPRESPKQSFGASYIDDVIFDPFLTSDPLVAENYAPPPSTPS